MDASARRRWIRRGLFALFIGPVLVFIAISFLPQPVAVDMAVLTRGPMLVTLNEEGETRVRDIYVVSAPVNGRLLRIDLDAGDPVQVGQDVVSRILPIDPDFLDARSLAQAEATVGSAQAALTLARAELERAQAEVEFSKNELRRAEELFAGNNVSEARLDRARLELRTARAALETARASVAMRDAELANAQARLVEPGDEGGLSPAGVLSVRAPISGRVLRLLAESEAVVAAGTPLVELGDTEDLEIVTDMLSTDAVQIAPGDPVIIEDWGGPGTLSGRVQRVEPFGFTKISALGIEEQRVNVIIDLLDPPAVRPSLGHGFRVQVRVVVWQGRDVVTIPTNALFRHRGEWAAFAVDDGRARLRILALGRQNDAQAQVLDGLVAGDRVILYPGEAVRDGVRVTERPQ